jgi:hypothetical protein
MGKGFLQTMANIASGAKNVGVALAVDFYQNVRMNHEANPLAGILVSRAIKKRFSAAETATIEAPANDSRTFE